jgi:hypothetical protein
MIFETRSSPPTSCASWTQNVDVSETCLKAEVDDDCYSSLTSCCCILDAMSDRRCYTKPNLMIFAVGGEYHRTYHELLTGLLAASSVRQRFILAFCHYLRGMVITDHVFVVSTVFVLETGLII